MRPLVLLKLAVNLPPFTCATCGCNFSCEYLHEFAKKILNCAKGIAKGPGNMNHEKTSDYKSRDSGPFNERISVTIF
jgi:hypothetical protein